MLLYKKKTNWVSEASPTMGCSNSHAKNAWAELRSPNTSMLKVCFGSLKQTADYNFCLEFLILPSSGRLKSTCDTRIIHFYYMLKQL